MADRRRWDVSAPSGDALSLREGGGELELITFEIDESLLHSFASTAELERKPSSASEEGSCIAHPMDACLSGYLQSLLPYFAPEARAYPGQFMLKKLELLYDISHTNTPLMEQILSLNYNPHRPLVEMMERYYTSSINVEELATLSGRSLSGFKRDFAREFGTTPARWIRERRLEKARQLLQTTSMSITDVAYTLGFESVSHFSQLYRKHYGVSPSQSKEES